MHYCKRRDQLDFFAIVIINYLRMYNLVVISGVPVLCLRIERALNSF